MKQQKKWRYAWAIVLLCGLFIVPLSAQQKFATAQLQKLSEQIDMPSSLKTGTNYRVAQFAGRPVTITLRDKMVTHIGYSLFAPSQRIREIESHCDFIERLLMASDIKEFYGTRIENYLKEEKIVFDKGSLQSLKGLIGDTSFNFQITMIDGRTYIMNFYVDNRRIITISYPVNLQLVHGATMQEIEGRIASDLRHTRVNDTPVFQPIESMLQRVSNGSIYLLPGDIYMLPQLTSNRYYVRHEDGTFHTLFSEDYPMESMANLCTSIDIATDLELSVLLVRYGHVKEDIRIPLRQWVAYCLQQGCTPYFGIVEQEDKRMTCEVVMHNEAFNYNHVLKFSFDPAVLATGKGSLEGRWNSYVQMSNVKSLFNDEK